MTLSLYDVSIPTCLHMLRNLAALLAKAETHARETDADLSTFMAARLAPDMHPLTRQIQMATDSAKHMAASLAGVEAPSFADTEATWEELKERVAKTIAYLETIKPDQVDGDPNRNIELPLPGTTLNFTPRDFLFNVSLPNIFFHVVTAYGLLRAQGVPLGKMDYLAGGSPLGG
jgi:hypothetical protein